MEVPLPEMGRCWWKNRLEKALLLELERTEAYESFKKFSLKGRNVTGPREV